MAGKVSLKKKEHKHLWDIPKKYFPRNTKAKEYLRDVFWLTNKLRHINSKVQYSAQICAYNIRSITGSKYVHPVKEEVFREIDEFVYHYENYCFRLHAYREKLIQLINAILPVGYTDKEVSIKHILINPIVKQAGIARLLDVFQKEDSALFHIINFRTKITHRLSFDAQDHYFRPPMDKNLTKKKFRSWCENWRKEIQSHADKTVLSTIAVSKINNQLATQIMRYKQSLENLRALKKKI